MLRSITGEFASDELPAHPSPSFPPEAVVQAQLYALRRAAPPLPGPARLRCAAPPGVLRPPRSQAAGP
jgi:hypothetical protein